MATAFGLMVRPDCDGPVMKHPFSLQVHTVEIAGAPRSSSVSGHILTLAEPEIAGLVPRTPDCRSRVGSPSGRTPASCIAWTPSNNAPRSMEVSSSPAFGRMNTVGGGDGAALRRRRHLESVSRPSPACCRRGRPWSTCPAQPRTTARSPRDQHRAGADTESRSRTTATTARCEPRRCSGGVPRQADHRDRSRRRPCSILPPGIPTCPTSYFYQLQGQGMADTFLGRDIHNRSHPHPPR